MTMTRGSGAGHRSVLVVNDTRVDHHHGCLAVMGAISLLLRCNGMEPLLFWPAHTEWRGDAEFESTIAKVDLVLINGEGTIHHDRQSGRQLLELGARARAEKVPVALINVGWEANGTDLVTLLNNFDLVVARDSRSAERMRAGGATVRVVPDLSLWFAQAQGIRPGSTGSRAGIGVTDNVDRFKALTLERLRSTCGGQMVSIVYGAPGPGSWLRFLREGVALSKDLRHPARLAALLRLRHRLWWQGSADTQRFLTHLAALKLLVSGRFHACTLALAAGTPLIAQASTTDKIAALFHDAGLDSWRCEGALNVARVHDASASGWSEQEYRSLCAYLDEAVSEVEILFSDLAKLAAN
ncbi:polysaccharide pyruvyl transferase family protein [Halomonas sp. M4R1S46]|uniref:polysaccharide pyruvyl transferase family protein n=1 Tax=Halomonas sp. M4R1S46 TaxID=2982692 RepID=UPI0021E4DA2A|nr:polysaccharide pyruvyl transferase family protein [Halomonas sp. M4R1S46]UYG06324.1 polysaccharide pyruvyl transferase family protein [Halomonas sp. M4R1S46]